MSCFPRARATIIIWEMRTWNISGQLTQLLSECFTEFPLLQYRLSYPLAVHFSPFYTL